MTEYNPSKQNIYENRNKTEEQIKRDNFRDQVVTSQFEWGPPATSPKATYQGSFTNTFANQENNDVGSLLNKEIRKNKDLVRHINNL